MSRRSIRGLIFAALLLWPAAASAWNHGQYHSSPVGQRNTQWASGFLTETAQGDEPFLNRMKEAQTWAQGSGGGTIQPNYFDFNGWPIPGTAGFAIGPGFSIGVGAAPMFQRPGNVITSWIGQGKVYSYMNAGTIASQACTGVYSGTDHYCDNTSCTPLTGSISSQVLTVTAPPGGSGNCGTLVPGQPLSIPSIAINAASYNATTGVVTLTLAASPPGITTGDTFTVLMPPYSGIGDFEKAVGTFAASAGTSGTTLTYTIASGLSMTLYNAPFQGAVYPVAITTFGVPTMITGDANTGSTCGGSACTGTGGSGTYLLNLPQTVASQSITGGGRSVVKFTGQTPQVTTTNTNYRMWINADTPGNAVMFLGMYLDADETTYESGELMSLMFKTREEQANDESLRDVNWSTYTSNFCTTWATRRSTWYYSYQGSDQRNILYVDANGDGSNGATFTGTIVGTSLVASNVVGTIYPGAVLSGAGITPATYTIVSGPGGAGTYVISGPTTVGSEAMTSEPTISYNATSNNFNIGGFGPTTNWVDKLMMNVQWPATGNATTTISMNGNAPVALFSDGGGINNGAKATSGTDTLIIFTTTLNLTAATPGGAIMASSNSLECGVPPDTFAYVNFEFGTNPWFVSPTMALDNMTDYIPSLASMVKNDYPTEHPIFEMPDEITFNYAPSYYWIFLADEQSYYYEEKDPTGYGFNQGCPASCSAGNHMAWIGKILTNVGQAVHNIYGNFNDYDVLGPAQLTTGGNEQLSGPFAHMIQATDFMNQTLSLIPLQVGCAGPNVNQNCPTFTQTPPPQWTTKMTASNYWSVSENGTQKEVSDAFCFYLPAAAATAAGCPSNASIMASYFSTQQATAADGVANDHLLWNEFAQVCGGATSPAVPGTGACTPGQWPQFKGLRPYEGGYSLNAPTGTFGTGNNGFAPTGGDQVGLVSGAVNSSACVLDTQYTQFIGTISGGTSMSIINQQGASVPGYGSFTGAGVSSGSTVWNTLAGSTPYGASTYTISPSQANAGPESMTASANGAVSGMKIEIVQGGGSNNWFATHGATNASTATTTNVLHFSTNPVLVASSQYVQDVTNRAAITSGTTVSSTGTGTVTMSADPVQTVASGDEIVFTDVTSNGVMTVQSGPTQATIPVNVDCTGWGNPGGTSTQSTISNGANASGNILNVGGTVTGTFAIGQVLGGTALPNTAGLPTLPSEIIIGSAANSATCGGSACTGTGGAGTYLVSANANIEFSCTACTIAGTALTLGGTITGTLDGGDTITGAGVTANSVMQANTVSSSGQHATLSQSSTVSTGTPMQGSRPINSYSVIQYVGSSTFPGYLNYFRESTFLTPGGASGGNDLYDITLGLYTALVNAGDTAPSQYQYSGYIGPTQTWLMWDSNLFGWFTIATCSACSISGNTLTLGGNIAGVFSVGNYVEGLGVNGLDTGETSPTTITGILTGTGRNAGDTLSLNNSSTVAAEGMMGFVAPQLDCSGQATDSPITQWAARREWNGNLCGAP